MENKSALLSLTGFGAIVAAFGFLLRSDDHVAAKQLSADVSAVPRRGVYVRANGLHEAIDRYARGRQLLAEFLGVTPHDLIAAMASDTTHDSTSETRLPGAGGIVMPVRRQLRVLIATVPDPQDSHLDWSYDAYVESYQRAFSAAGFVPDRFWLPAKDDSLRLELAGADSAAYALHDVEPGVMLFRSTRSDELALLYLVNELPTGGIHKWAFAAAVRERHRLLQSPLFRFASNDRDSLRVIGPSFSGSARSLRIALQNAFSEDTALRASVVSGAATSMDTAALGLHTRFRATVLSDDAMDSGVDYVLQALGIPESDVAILTESATQYGQLINDSTHLDETGQGVREVAPSAPDGPATANAKNITRRQYLRFVFPLNIATLRSSFSRATGTNAPRDLLTIDQVARPELSLAEQARTRESPPVAAPRLTVPSLDLALRELTSALARHGVRAVLIKATDVRDKLMLAEELKSSLRDVQLFIFENHVLLSREEYSPYLRGAYVISSYPMTLENQWWSRQLAATDDRSRMAFAADAAVGVFNATLTILGAPDLRKEYSHFGGVDSLRDVGPALWVSLVGRNGLVPLVALRPNGREYSRVDRSGSQFVKVPSGQAAAHRHNGMLSMLVMIAGLALLVALLVALSRDGAKTAHGQGMFGRHLLGGLSGASDARGKNTQGVSARWAESMLSEARELVFSLSLLNSLVTLVLCAASARILASHSYQAFSAIAAVMTMAMLVTGSLLTLASTVGMVRVLPFLTGIGKSEAARATGSTKRRERIALGTVVANSVLTTAGTIVVMLLAYRSTAGVSDSAVALAFRTASPANGVSPFLPLLLLSVSCVTWSWWQLEQVRSVETRRTPFENALVMQRNPSVSTLPSTAPPVAPGDAGEKEHIARMLRADKRLTDAFTRFLPPRNAWLPVVVVLVAFVTVISQYERSPEAVVFARYGRVGLTYDLLMQLGPLSLMVTILWATFRMYFGWIAVDELSQAITEWPLNNAFARLPKGVSSLTHVGLIGSTELEREENAARELEQKVRVKLSDLNFAENPIGLASLSAFEPLTSEVKALSGMEGSWRRAREGRRDTMTALLMSAALHAWRETGTRPKDDGDMPQGEKPLSRIAFAALRSCEEYLAFEAVAYLESILSNIRRLAFFLLVALVAAVALVGSYPIQPSSLIKSALVVLLLFAVIVLFVVMTGMSKNPLLSRLTGTTPGKVTWDTTLMLNMVLFAILPLLVLASSEFPSMRTMLFSWTEPALRSIGRY